MKRFFGSLAIVLLASVMTAYGYTQAKTCCEGQCGCGENSTCMKAGHCDSACDNKTCCQGKTASATGSQTMDCGKGCGPDCAKMCPGMKHAAPAAAPAPTPSIP